MSPRGRYPLVLLCGGENDRLQELRGTIYKAFLDLHGSTMVAKHIERARRDTVSRILVLVDRSDHLVDALVEGYQQLAPGLPVELHTVPGTTAEKTWWVHTRIADATEGIFVSFADTFSLYSHSAMLAARDRTSADSVLIVARFQMPFGTVVTDAERVIEFAEKPPLSCDISLGQMFLGMDALRMIGEGSTIAESLEALAQQHRLAAVRAEIDRFVTVDSLHDVARALGFFSGEAAGSGPAARIDSE